MGGYVTPEECVPQDHPLRSIREMANLALSEMSPLFEKVYSLTGRPSIPPEQLLRALLLQVLFTIRSERQIMEQLTYNFMFRWFVGLGASDPVWTPTTFTKNRDRFLDGEIAAVFFDRVLAQARAANLISEEHFSVDGTLIEAWASQKSFQPKQPQDGDSDGQGPKAVKDLGEGGKNPSVDFHGEKRSNETHASVTDPDARLARKNAGSAAVLAYSGNAVMENRSGLVVDTLVLTATGTAECDAAGEMMAKIALASEEREIAGCAGVPKKDRCPPCLTVGADKKYDTKEFIHIIRDVLGIAPHIARNVKRNGGSALDESVTQDEGYQISLRKRKLIEEIFGWAKTVGLIRKVKHRGLGLVNWILRFNAAAYNLVRMVKLFARAKALPQPA